MFKFEFDKCKEIEFKSQIGQDIFVLHVLNGKRNGYFIDVGSHEPIFINNSYILEKEFNWSGIMLEKDPVYFKKYSQIRNCHYFCVDACKFNYREKFKELNFPVDMDYLSMDLDPPSVTFDCLRKLPLDEYRFAIITYEHDVYRAINKYQKESRIIFKNYGYEIICQNVTRSAHENNPFEDWYVHPDLVDLNRVEKFKISNTWWKKILFS